MTSSSRPANLPPAVDLIDQKVDHFTAAAVTSVAEVGYNATLAVLFVRLRRQPPDALAALAAGAVTRLAVQAQPAPRRPRWRWRRW